MKIHNISNMKRGWFIGPFEPTLIRTNAFECASKFYRAGHKETAHIHKIATEITVIICGTVCMNGNVYESGTIVEIAPGEASDFEALTDVTTFVVKVPGIQGDKYDC